MKLEYAKRQIIDSTWYLGYDVTAEGRVEIHLHDRDPHKAGAETPEAHGEYELVETPQRVVTHVVIDGCRYTVSNPGHVFSYRSFEDQSLTTGEGE